MLFFPKLGCFCVGSQEITGADVFVIFVTATWLAVCVPEEKWDVRAQEAWLCLGINSSAALATLFVLGQSRFRDRNMKGQERNRFVLSPCTRVPECRGRIHAFMLWHTENHLQSTIHHISNPLKCGLSKYGRPILNASSRERHFFLDSFDPMSREMNPFWQVHTQPSPRTAGR